MSDTSEQLFELVVADRTVAAEDVILLDLRDPRGGDLPPWEPGAHIDLLLGPDLVRQYSLCGDPAERAVYRVGILLERDGRGGSARAHTLGKGDRIAVQGPRNHFPLAEASRYLFIAGGIGITPLVPMIAAADARGADWQLVYGGRSRDSMSFRPQLEARASDRVILYPQDEVGLIDLDRHLANPVAETMIYACGPAPLLDAVERATSHWPAGALHVERFTPKAVGEPVRSTAFEVELARSGLTVTVPRERSILEVVTEAGVDVLTSCTEGTCGTCETLVLSGCPDHRDSVLSADERQHNETMMICVSRAISDRLVLDL